MNHDKITHTSIFWRDLMSETVLVAVAWPYGNSEIHVGNLVGSYLPADIFARYNRLKGKKVLIFKT